MPSSHDSDLNDLRASIGGLAEASPVVGAARLVERVGTYAQDRWEDTKELGAKALSRVRALGRSTPPRGDIELPAPTKRRHTKPPQMGRGR